MGRTIAEGIEIDAECEALLDKLACHRDKMKGPIRKPVESLLADEDRMFSIDTTGPTVVVRPGPNLRAIVTLLEAAR